MRDLSVVVENLRLVQRARRRFMELWAVENDYINPVLDRMAEDLQRVAGPQDRDNAAGDGFGLNPPGLPDE
jgi:hypothetical protein